MKDVKGTENIPDDVVNIIFDFCKAFKKAQDKAYLSFYFNKKSCNFLFDFQKRKFVCNITYGSIDKKKYTKCIIDVSQDDHLDDENVENKTIEQDEVIEFDNDKSELNKDINKNKNKDNKVNCEISDEKEGVSSISDDDGVIKINDIKKTSININDIQAQQNNIALISKQGNSIVSNDYLIVRENTIFLAKENNDQKFDVYCFFLGDFCDAKIKKNEYVKSNTVKIASNIEKKKIQTFLKNVERGKSSECVVAAISSRAERTVTLKKFFNANAFSPEEVKKINDEANSNLCKFNCCGLCG